METSWSKIITHSFLALGQNNKKSVNMAKQGYSLAFQTNYLHNICHQYMPYSTNEKLILGLRKLRNSKS